MTPQWQSRSDSDRLRDLVAKVSAEVRSNPSMQQVIGLDDETIHSHAEEAIKAYLHFHKGPIELVEALTTSYIMGFVVGARFGQSDQHPQRNRDGTN